MIPTLRHTAILVSLLAGFGAESAAAQQTATPAERCSGTLCDLYYGGPSPQAQPGAQTAAPKPLTAQSGGILGFFSGGSTTQQPTAPGATPARRLVGVGGGGLAAMARGDAPERCSGTICDLYYGGPAPAKLEPQAAQPMVTEQQAAAEPASETELEPAQPAIRYRPLPETKPSCAAKPGDPWSCYR